MGGNGKEKKTDPDRVGLREERMIGETGGQLYGIRTRGRRLQREVGNPGTLRPEDNFVVATSATELSS
jgi:hypothetical protein